MKTELVESTTARPILSQAMSSCGADVHAIFLEINSTVCARVLGASAKAGTTRAPAEAVPARAGGKGRRRTRRRRPRRPGERRVGFLGFRCVYLGALGAVIAMSRAAIASIERSRLEAGRVLRGHADDQRTASGAPERAVRWRAGRDGRRALPRRRGDLRLFFEEWPLDGRAGRRRDAAEILTA